jgi:capsular polysaccharide transport system permease protein
VASLDREGNFDERSLLMALRIQIRVIAALIWRETQEHFGETRLGYLWAIIEPITMLLVYIVVFKYVLVRHVPIGTSLTLFLLTGMVPYFLYSKLTNYLMTCIVGSRNLLNLPPVKIFDVMVARTILETITYLLVGCIMFAAVWISGVPEALPRAPLQLVEVIIVVLAFAFGFGAINAAMTAYFPQWPMFFARAQTPLWLLSGLWFIPGEVPPPYRDYLLYNPLMHFISWFRAGFYPPYTGGYLDKGYAIEVSAAAFIIGLVVLRAARRKMMSPV